MGRKRRSWMPEYYYHIVSRGNRRDALFLDDNDFRVFLYILRQTSEKNPCELASYCLMTNHYHLQLRTEQSISKFMFLLNKRYANYYNTRYNLTGHVFEERFFDRIAASDYSMLKVSRYIHLNPLEAGMVMAPEDYPWSSYRYYFNSSVNTDRLLNMEAVLGIFSGTQAEKKRKYKEFVADELIRME